MSAQTNEREQDDDQFKVSDVVDQLRRLRAASQRRRYRGATPQLPSREATIEVVDNVVQALYPRHFGPQGLSAREVDVFVARTLGSAADGDPANAGEIVVEFAASLPTVRALVDADVRAGLEGDPSAASVDEIIFSFPGVAAILRHRIAHRLYCFGAPMLARIVAEDAHSRTGIDIHPGAEIGERFFIDHGTGVVIGETAIIGRNVRLYQAVTLGAVRFETDDTTGGLRKNYPRHPIVENDVVIYAGATILGRITIGKGSTIGGNVWLTHSVPAGSRVTQAKARNESFDGGAGI
jgi:serine O-acetyltransferase